MVSILPNGIADTCGILSRRQTGQLQVFTIAFSDTRAHVKEYVSSNPDTFVYPIAYDQDNRVAQAFGVTATPTFVVMDAEGEMVLAHRGAGINRNPQYQEFLRSLK